MKWTVWKIQSKWIFLVSFRWWRTINGQHYLLIWRMKRIRKRELTSFSRSGWIHDTSSILTKLSACIKIDYSDQNQWYYDINYAFNWAKAINCEVNWTKSTHCAETILVQNNSFLEFYEKIKVKGQGVYSEFTESFQAKTRFRSDFLQVESEWINLEPPKTLFNSEQTVKKVKIK